MSPEVWAGGLIGIFGSVLLYVIQRLATRPERIAKSKAQEAAQALKAVQVKTEQQVAIDASIASVASLWREDNKDLRERARLTEIKQAATDARLEDVLKTNAILHQDNLTLTEKNGALTERTESQAAQIKKLTETMQSQGAQIIELQADNITLINAMRKAGIPIPPLTADTKPGTGPLGQAKN